jgi:SAM-dependent methyltransferase
MPLRSSHRPSTAGGPPSRHFDPERQNQANKQAWNELYASTSHLVWGSGAVGFLEEFLRPEVARPRSFRRVLDAGSGEGRNLPLLLGVADVLTACDASEAALAKVPARIKPHVRLVPCDLAHTPFAEASFDFILLCDTVETLPDPAPVFREMRRILAPGGALVCNIPGPEGDVAGIDMTEIGRESYLYRDRYFYRFFRDDEVAALFAATGWRAERTETMTWVEPAHPGYRAEAHQHRSRVYLITPANQ